MRSSLGRIGFEFDHFLMIVMIAFIIAIFIPIINQLWRDKFTDNINNQPERVAVDHIDVASLTPGRGIIMTFFHLGAVLVFFSAKIDLLVIATNLPRAYILPLKGLFVPTLTTILVSLQCTDTEMKK